MTGSGRRKCSSAVREIRRRELPINGSAFSIQGIRQSRCAGPVTNGGAAFSRQTLSYFLHTSLLAEPQIAVRQRKPNEFVRIRFWYQNCLMNSEHNVTQTRSSR